MNLSLVVISLKFKNDLIIREKISYQIASIKIRTLF